MPVQRLYICNMDALSTMPVQRPRVCNIILTSGGLRSEMLYFLLGILSNWNCENCGKENSDKVDRCVQCLIKKGK